MANKSFTKLFNAARQRDSYWSEKGKLQFAIELFDLMERRGITKSELAETIGSSPSYITKALRGDTNFTIESMIKLVRALDGKLFIHVTGNEDAEHRFVKIGHTTSFTAGTNEHRPMDSGGIASNDNLALEIA